jgi:hypothetical protein
MPAHESLVAPRVPIGPTHGENTFEERHLVNISEKIHSEDIFEQQKGTLICRLLARLQWSVTSC